MEGAQVTSTTGTVMNKETAAAAIKDISRAHRRGLWNSILLTLFFVSFTSTGYSAGNYLIVGLGVLASFGTCMDAISFYQLGKALKQLESSVCGVVEHGQN